MKLLEYDNGDFFPDPQMLILKPFKKIIDRDKTKNKVKANNELAYIFHLCDIRSDFSDITSEEERSKLIIEGLELPDNWIPDNVVNEAIEYYKERSLTPGLQLLGEYKGLLSRASEYVKTIDINSPDDLKKAITAAKDIPVLINTVEEMEIALLKKSGDDSTAKGTIQKGFFEDDM